jgi:hypothetical protein
MRSRAAHPLSRLVPPLIALAALVLRIVYVRESGLADDAYITFRYARNIASGLGFVYNAGEKVLGTTTPLYTLILVPFAWIRIPLDSAAVFLAIGADLLTCFLVYRLIARRFDRPTALLGAFIYATLYPAAAGCGYGMETQIFHLLVLGTIEYADAGRRNVAAALVGGAAITRPEGYLAGAILGIALLIEWRERNRDISYRRRTGFPWQPPVVFLLVIAPWIIFATAYFGTPVPNSVLAKAQQPDVGLGEWARFFLLRNPLVILLWVMSAIGTLSAYARRSFAALVVAAWAALYVLFFAFARPPFMGVWYFPPVAFALAILSGIGVVEILRRFVGRPERAALIAGLAWAALSAYAIPHSIATVRWSKVIADHVYRPMSEWVGKTTAPGDLIDTCDIGYVGFLTNRKILDHSALVSPEVMKFYRERSGDRNRDVALVMEKLPEVVIIQMIEDTYRRFTENGLLEAYTLAARFPVEGPIEFDPPPGSDPSLNFGKTALAEQGFLAFRRLARD